MRRRKMLLISAFITLLLVSSTAINSSQALDIILIENSVTINGGQASTYFLSLTLTLTQGLHLIGKDVVSMRFTNHDPSVLPPFWSAWEPYASTKYWSLDSGSYGIRTVWAQYLLADTTISTTFSDTIEYKQLADQFTI